MRNLKKILALVLALMMTLSLMVTANATSFTDDSKINSDYAEAAEVLTDIGIFQGDNKGQFLPDTVLNRKDASTLIYRIMTGDVADKYVSNYAGYASQFSDVSENAWYAPYVSYAATQGYIKGYDGKFNPDAPLTGIEVLTILLRAVGYDQFNEFSTDWVNTVAKLAQKVGISIPGVVLTAPVTREVAAELIFQVMTEVKMVEYTSGLGYQPIVFTGNSVKGIKSTKTLGQKMFSLTGPTDINVDDWGRPGYKYTYVVNGEAGSTVFAYDPISTYTEATKQCDILADTELSTKTELAEYVNGIKADAAYKLTDSEKQTYGEQGRLTEVYADRIINIDTYLANVDQVNAEKTDKNGHVTPASIDVTVYSEQAAEASKDGNEVLTTGNYETDDVFAEGDKVLVTVSEKYNDNGVKKYTVQSAEAAKATVGQLTKIDGNKAIIDDITKVLTINGEKAVLNYTATYEDDTLKLSEFYIFYYDQHGNVIGAVDRGVGYVVLDSLYRNTVNGDSTASGTVVDFTAEAASGTIANIDHDTAPDFDTAKQYNGEYYYDVYTYSEHDGIYTLKDANFVETKSGQYAGGSFELKVTIPDTSSTATAGATKEVILQLKNSTQVLLQTTNSPDGTYKSYVGYKDLPSFRYKEIEYHIDQNGYVDYLYARGEELTSRTVFVYDIHPDTLETSEYPGWNVATIEAQEIVNGKLNDTTFTVLYPHEAGDRAAIEIDHIGLYDIVEAEYEGFFYATREHQYYGITKVDPTTDGLRVNIGNSTGISNSTGMENLEDAVIAKYNGSWISGDKAKTVKADTLDTQSVVFVQRDEDGNIVGVFDIWVPLKVTVRTPSLDKDGKVEYNKDGSIKYLYEGDKGFPEITLEAPELYFGKTMPTTKDKNDKDVIVPIELTIPEYWDLSSVESKAAPFWNDSNDLDNDDFDVKGEDNHDKAASFDIVAADNKGNAEKLYDDVVITIVTDPKHSSAWVNAVDPGSKNINVEVTTAQAAGTQYHQITVTGDQAMTANVGDLLKWLVPKCENDEDATHKACNHVTIRVYDNTVETDVTEQTTKLLNNNMFVIVTAEDRKTTARYDITVVKTYNVQAGSFYGNSGAVDSNWSISITPEVVDSTVTKLTVKVTNNGSDLQNRDRTFTVKNGSGAVLATLTQSGEIKSGDGVEIEINNPGKDATIDVFLEITATN